MCLSATKGEATAAERLRVGLVQALGKYDLRALIATAGPKGSNPRRWRNGFETNFSSSTALFSIIVPSFGISGTPTRPGSVRWSTITNSPTPTWENSLNAYLGDWIRRQQVAVDASEAGRDIPLEAARRLHDRLKLILEGEPPYDLFVRWKPLAKQAIGWHPDINNGVRMNIRPIANADILRKRVKIRWDKDRGKEPAGGKNEFPWFWGWDEDTQDFTGVGKEPDGNRWNDCHYTNEMKRKAREANQAR